ncbi:MAG TPA: 2OG-Fe(II) oxygenase, partial [Sphingomicrobium sp.]|nr:2OG-Fe(II) oxygenase [Sphingomicrobium sp.]
MSTIAPNENIPWDRFERELDERGWATTGPLLTADQRDRLVESYDDDRQFRSRVILGSHGFGQGEYRYFAYPLPPLIQQLRQAFYGRLAPIANRWRAAFGEPPLPGTLEAFLDLCHAAGQARPTPLLLRYGPGDYNCLHQDLYG